MLLFDVARAEIAREVAVGDTGEVEVLALAVACHLAAAPAIVDGGFSSSTAPSYESTCVAASFDGACAEAVLDEECRR